jgi:hypothetical protein
LGGSSYIYVQKLQKSWFTAVGPAATDGPLGWIGHGTLVFQLYGFQEGIPVGLLAARGRHPSPMVFLISEEIDITEVIMSRGEYVACQVAT